MNNERLSVLKGTLELLVLKTLGRGGEMHGFAILDWIRESTSDALVIEEGALYPALHRMEKRGWLTADWAVSEKGRRAKYYRLTSSGQKALVSEAAQWERYVAAMSQVASEASV